MSLVSAGFHRQIDIVELIDETDELVGYGVCVTTTDLPTRRQTFRMEPEVHGTRSQAHSAALDIRDTHTKGDS